MLRLFKILVPNVFTLSNRGRIKISEEALQKMQSYRQDNQSKPESGGVLLGRFIVGSKDIVIDEVTAPMKTDLQLRSSFKRSKAHQRVVDRRWVESNNTVHYLGEWHTHPESSPDPSSLDLRSWKEKLKEATFSSRYLYFIIIGIDEFGVWEGDRRTSKIRKIENYGW